VEMGHDFHLYAVRWFGIMLSKISKRLYSSIQVNTDKFDKVSIMSRCLRMKKIITGTLDEIKNPKQSLCTESS